MKKPNKLSSNEQINIFKYYLTIKKLEDLGLNTLKKRHIQIKELDKEIKNYHLMIILIL